MSLVQTVAAEPLLPAHSFTSKRISRPRALHHHDAAVVPAKAILRISARSRPTHAACFWFAFMHAFAKTCLVARDVRESPLSLVTRHPSPVTRHAQHKEDFRLRTCTSRTSRTSSARSLPGFSRRPHLTSGEEGRREKPSAELGISHSHVLLISVRDARLRDTVSAVSCLKTVAFESLQSAST